MKCQCDICGKKFRNRKSMTNHRRWHDLPQYKESQSKHRKNISIKRIAEKNPNWGGDLISVGALHGRLNREIRLGYFPSRKKPAYCMCCGKKTTFLDLANISGKYSTDINDYEYICRQCHMKKDGRLNRLHLERKNI